MKKKNENDLSRIDWEWDLIREWAGGDTRFWHREGGYQAAVSWVDKFDTPNHAIPVCTTKNPRDLLELSKGVYYRLIWHFYYFFKEPKCQAPRGDTHPAFISKVEGLRSGGLIMHRPLSQLFVCSNAEGSAYQYGSDEIFLCGTDAKGVDLSLYAFNDKSYGLPEGTTNAIKIIVYRMLFYKKRG